MMETHEKIVKPIQEEKENLNVSSPEETHEANTSFGQGPRKSKQLDRNRFNFKLGDATQSGPSAKKFDKGPRGEEIEGNYNKILEILQNWDQKIAVLLKQNEDDFLYAYKDQMFQVQKELKLLKKKIDEETLKQKTDDKINILEEERDYFRAEALRLDKHCKDQQRIIEEIKFKNKILSEDRDYYEEFVIETKKENKALKTELVGFYTKNSKKSPKSKPMTADEIEGRRTKYPFKEEGKEKDSFFQTQPLSGDSWVGEKRKGNVVEEVKRLRENEGRFVQKINDLNAQIERDRLLMKKIRNEEVSKDVKRAELEQILLDCVNEIRRDIIKRKSIMFLRENSKTILNNEDVDFSKFSANDKRKLIEHFMNNEKVLELLYCITFTNQYTLERQPKKLAESWKLNFNQIQSQYANYKDLRSTLMQNSAKPIWAKEVFNNSNHFSKKTKSLIKQIQT